MRKIGKINSAGKIDIRRKIGKIGNIRNKGRKEYSMWKLNCFFELI